MVKSVLHDINTVQQLLDRDRYFRVKSGFINVHKAEVSALLRIHGQRAISLFRTHLSESCKLIYGVLFQKDARIPNILPSYRVFRSNPLAVQFDTSIQARNSLNSAQQSAQMVPNSQSAIDFNRASVNKSPSSQLNASELSPQQIRERAMLISREFHYSQPAQQTPGQTDPLHGQQIQTQPLDALQARAMQLQRQQQMQRQMLNMQNRPVNQSPPVPQMQLRRPNLNQINQLSNRPHGIHQSAPSKPFDSDLPILSPQPYQQRVQSESEIPDHSMAAKARRAPPPKLPIPITQPSEGDVKQSSPGLAVPDVRIPPSTNQDSKG